MQNRKAFTMIELIFVVVVIGILAGIAIPKFAMTRNDAILTKAKDTVGAVRSAMATERQKRILRGDFSDFNKSIIGNNFSNLLEYGVKSCTGSRCGGWETGGTESDPTFTFHGPTGDVVFKLDSEKRKLVCDNGPCTDYE
jgi:general secretion pathway protein G